MVLPGGGGSPVPLAIAPTDLRQLSGHDATPRTFAGGAGPLAALDTGTGATRGTALLVAGYTGSKEDFAPLLAPLADAGLRAVAIDQRGQYESPGPDDPAATRSTSWRPTSSPSSLSCARRTATRCTWSATASAGSCPAAPCWPIRRRSPR
jgi:pimeloyl-ACP methyl ester carboxylesterase